jgi:hypothetical protein
MTKAHGDKAGKYGGLSNYGICLLVSNDYTESVKYAAWRCTIHFSTKRHGILDRCVATECSKIWQVKGA